MRSLGPFTHGPLAAMHRRQRGGGGGRAALMLQALKLEPSDARIYEARAHAHIKLEQYSEANADATRALELDPQLGKAFLRKG